jgi:hypothetical protein
MKATRNSMLVVLAIVLTGGALLACNFCGLVGPVTPAVLVVTATPVPPTQAPIVIVVTTTPPPSPGVPTTPMAKAPAGTQTQSAPATPTTAVQDPNTLLATAKTQVASLKRARFTFQRTAYDTQSSGAGWLQMPDRAQYTLSEGSKTVEWLVVRNQPWFRDHSGAEWVMGIQTVALVNNPAVWLHLLSCAQQPRLLLPETIGSDACYVVTFNVAPAKPGDCDPFTGLTALSGDGVLYLRQKDGGIQRLSYNLTFSHLMHGGSSNETMQVALDLSEWNGNLPAIEEPRTPGVSTAAPPRPTPVPSAELFAAIVNEAADKLGWPERANSHSYESTSGIWAAAEVLHPSYVQIFRWRTGNGIWLQAEGWSFCPAVLGADKV